MTTTATIPSAVIDDARTLTDTPDRLNTTLQDSKSISFKAAVRLRDYLRLDDEEAEITRTPGTRTL
ncbi:hypothetical protein PTQ19_12060 [Microbacterium esteraromaticum]|uniref:hypothetical protein n=1 Tax=Microbacterium esteraromaticum TaxID=57043 RepID=UPI0023679111|nr:hypothetical protein [Microbacterium esteraromaticum]WDH78245.1 hypothetical protein PTQ19_12060 [Microbacterium esteraromaticum]